MYPTQKQDFKSYERLKNEVEHYFYYSVLIQKKRSEEARKKVEDVILRIPNIVARINEIEKIDSEDQEKNPGFYKVEEGKKERIRPAMSFEEYNKIGKEQESDKKKIKKLRVSGFINFFFGTRKLLKQFSSKTQMLHSKFFGLSFALSSHYYHTVEELNKQINFSVVEATRLALEIGWLVLSKKQYNVLYTFFNFIKEYITFTSKVKHDTSVGELTTFLNNVIPYYLQLIQTEQNRIILVEAIHTVLSQSSKHRQFISIIVDLVFRLFNVKETGKLNFYQIFIPIFNLYYRKVLTLNDIKESYIINPISDEVFICEQKIALKIEERIDKIETEINEVEKELYIIKPIESGLDFFSFSNDDFVNISLRIIGSAKNIEKNKSEEIGIIDYFNKDLLYGFQIYLKGFIKLFSDFLMGNVKVKNNGKTSYVRIFNPDYFKEQFEKIKECLKDIDEFRALNTHINISSTIYANFIKTFHLEIEKDEKACLLIHNSAKAFYNFYLKLSQALYQHHQIMVKGIDDPMEIQSYIQKELDNNGGKNRVLPYYFYKIEFKEYETEPTVLQIFNDIAFFCVNISRMFEVQEIMSLMQKKEFLISKSEQLLKERARYI